MNSRPYRSAMWCGCHGVGLLRSAHGGTASSRATMTKKSTRCGVPWVSRIRPQPTMQSDTPATFRRAVRRPSRLACAARSHCATSATRMRRTPG
jgi:hypothetical protein